MVEVSTPSSGEAEAGAETVTSPSTTEAIFVAEAPYAKTKRCVISCNLLKFAET